MLALILFILPILLLRLSSFCLLVETGEEEGNGEGEGEEGDAGVGTGWEVVD